MIDRPNDLNTEKAGQSLSCMESTYSHQTNHPCAVVLCSFIGTSGMHVARLVHIRRVGDESTSKFSV